MSGDLVLMALRIGLIARDSRGCRVEQGAGLSLSDSMGDYLSNTEFVKKQPPAPFTMVPSCLHTITQIALKP